MFLQNNTGTLFTNLKIQLVPEINIMFEGDEIAKGKHNMVKEDLTPLQLLDADD